MHGCADWLRGALLQCGEERESTPRRRSPAKIPDTDEAGATVQFQSQTFKVARYCVRKQVEEKDAGVVEWNPTPVRPLRNEGNEVEVEEEKVDTIASTWGSRRQLPRLPGSDPGAGITVGISAGTVVAPTFSSTSCAGVPFDRNCEQSQAPVAERTQSEKLTWGHLHRQCSQRGCHRKDATGPDGRCGSEAQNSGR